MLRSISRRDVLVSNRDVAAAGRVRTSSVAAPAHHGPELFVFRPADERNLVFAVILDRNEDRPAQPECSGFQVRIHTGKSSWTVTGPPPGETDLIWKQHDGRCFAGDVLGHHPAGVRTHSAVVVESQPGFVRAGESLSVWAELLTDDGLRRRAGNPFVSDLVARDPVLFERYHRASPKDDRALFSDAFAHHIASMAANTGVVADPLVHAQRMAAFLLPDVIKYSPELPVGFDFAQQNGRHPADETPALVETVLTGAITLRTTSPPFRLQEAFPYFLRPPHTCLATAGKRASLQP